MPKALKKSQATRHISMHETTGAELLVLFENDEDADALERVRSLGQENYIAVLRSLQKLNEALANYATSWKSIELP